VLTVPFELRARLGFDGKLLGAVARLFVDSVLGWYRRRLRASTRERAESGTVVVQRAWSDDPTLALEALRKSLRMRRPPRGFLNPSDRVSSYAGRTTERAPRLWRRPEHEPEGQRRSFFATLRAELVDHELCPTREAAMRPIRDYFDNFYNIERRHSHIHYLNPIELELRSQVRGRVA
jgi:hypothetical protein